MSADTICTICGKKFSVAVAGGQAVCADCKAAAVSERPMPPDRPAATAIQSGMPKANPPVGSAAELTPDGWMRPKTALHGWIYAGILAIVAAAAVYVFLVQGCGWSPFLDEPSNIRKPSVPESEGEGDNRKV
jgi:hypothetical protein